MSFTNPTSRENGPMNTKPQNVGSKTEGGDNREACPSHKVDASKGINMSNTHKHLLTVTITSNDYGVNCNPALSAKLACLLLLILQITS